MNTLTVDLDNCFGIEKLSHTFDFSNRKPYSIYARNGMMKTSFANTFQLLHEGKEAEICDKIFGYPGYAKVEIDGRTIGKEQIFVVKSFESYYESNISPLLIKGQIQEQLQETLAARAQFLKILEKASGLKIQRTVQGKKKYELEPQIIEDFAFTENSILLNLDELDAYTPEVLFEDVQYSAVFDPKAINKICDPAFQAGLSDYMSATDKIYDSFRYLEKGKLTLPKLKRLRKELDNDSFFVKDNHIVLSGEESVADLNALDMHITEIETQIRQLPAYQKIESLLNDVAGASLKDVIETHPDIVEYLSMNELNNLKKILWGSYIKVNSSVFTNLRKKYSLLSEAIDSINVDDTPWKHALDIFTQRFSVPFSMSVANLKGAIIGESVPRVQFTFTHEHDSTTIARDKLEELNTLSQGEKRALYLLNIIFDIEKIKASNQETILIVDDIADSFDYKNKYAIIEYLYELADEPNLHLIILTHNFDFHRTISNRLDLSQDNRLMAEVCGSTISLRPDQYYKQPFDYWRNKPNEKSILALIPFVRNLVQYGRDRGVCKTERDYLFLTELLHEKANTSLITFAELKPLYKEYMNIDCFEDTVALSDYVLERLYTICDGIEVTDASLENKIILAIGIRHKTEEFLINEIKKYNGSLYWEKSGNKMSPLDYLSKVDQSNKPQTRALINAYHQFGRQDIVRIIDEVNIMTPESIHFNSFMYEPLLDMDVSELFSLYRRVQALQA